MAVNANTSASMDSIKKKMQSLKVEKDNAADRADQAEQRQQDLQEKLKLSEEESTSLQKKIQLAEAELDGVQEQLAEANAKLEAKEKAAVDVSILNLNNGTLRSLTRTPQQQQSSSSSSMNDSGSSVIDTIRKRMQQIKDELAKSHDDLHAYQIEREREKHAREQAEGEIGGVTRRIQLVEEDLERTEERLSQATQKLDEASHAADESERGRKTLEQRTYQSDERIGTLEQQLAEAQLIAEDSDRKYDEVARRIAVMEVDLERAEDRAEAAEAIDDRTQRTEAKIAQYEQDWKHLHYELRSKEMFLTKALQREESYEEQIRDLSTRLKDAEQRADLAERTMAKLQKEVDRLEDELLQEKEKYKGVSDELDMTLNELSGY
ncbi:unnamed protein product [Adineta steineri]|uniref:Tropomyosin n=1 Tax=Adineta steineri TaxID=433720 RepID=A0A816CI32_9BILA|nr:unnamed protein product [Adineta steineri]